MLKLIFLNISLLMLINKSKYSWNFLVMMMMVISMYSMSYIYMPMLNGKFYYMGIYLDLMSVILINLTIWISFLMIMSSQMIMMNKMNNKMFLFWLLVLNLVLLLTFSMSSYISFYVMFESSLVPTMFLILGWGYQPERLQASMYLMLYTISASLPLLLGLMMIYNNNVNFFMNSILYMKNNYMLDFMWNIWWLSIIMAFMVKMPLYMFHLWLPKAHVEAPVAGSMVLAAILLKLGGYGLIRVSSIFPMLNYYWASLYISLAMWGACVTSMICIRQSDMKSLIAYSSVGHMGLMISGFMTMTSWGWLGSLLIMFAHGLCSSGLFSLANMTYEGTHTRSIFLTKGLLNISPYMCVLWFMLSIANMAAPPTLNLGGEIILLTSILSFSNFSSLFIGITSFLAACYSLLLYSSTQHGQSMFMMNSNMMFSYRNMNIIMLHLVPLYMLVMNISITMIWI